MRASRGRRGGGGCARCVDASAQCVMREVRTFDINRLQLVLEVKHRPCGLAVRGAARDAVNGFSSHHALDRRDVRVRGRLLLQGASRGACARRARHGGVTELDSRPCGTCRAPPRARRASTMETRALGGTFRFAARLCVFRDRKIKLASVPTFGTLRSRAIQLAFETLVEKTELSWVPRSNPSARHVLCAPRVDVSSVEPQRACHCRSRRQPLPARLPCVKHSSPGCPFLRRSVPRNNDRDSRALGSRRARVRDGDQRP